MNTHPDKSAVDRAIDAAGGLARVASHFQISAWAVSKWRRKFPAERVIELARLAGWKVTPHEIEPKLYPHPNDGLPEARRSAPDGRISAQEAAR